MKLAVIVGSHRINSQSGKVGQWLSERIPATLPGVTAELISLAGNPLPLWDEEVWAGGGVWPELWAPFAAKLRECDGLVVISPEWHGMVPSGLKNFLLLCSPKEVGHKPALLVSVSAGLGGSYPIAELRMSGYKNNRMCVIPEHVIVRQVQGVLNTPEPADDNDRILRERLSWSLAVLHQYALALRGVRESGVTVNPAFPNGM